MAIVAKESERSKDFAPAPTGLHQAVCCDVVDMGLIKTMFDGKEKQQHKVRLAWQIAELNPENGKPFLVQKRYTLSLDEKANLRKDLESWRGRSFTPAELGGFDLEILIGINCQLNVVQVTKDSKTYANVQAVVPLGRGMSKMVISKDFVRFKDRAPDAGNGNGGHTDPAPDDDVPF